jgi:hypothetical protein
LVAVLWTLRASAAPVPGPEPSQVGGMDLGTIDIPMGETVFGAQSKGILNPFSGPLHNIDPITLGNVEGCVVNLYIFNGLHSQELF